VAPLDIERASKFGPEVAGGMCHFYHFHVFFAGALIFVNQLPGCIIERSSKLAKKIFVREVYLHLKLLM
jgi:hypothetical protein